MPRGLVRYHKSGGFHFITFSCYRREALLGRAAAYAAFERELETVRRRYGLVVADYDWQWSSFRHYATGVEGPVEIESEWTARRREAEQRRAREQLRIPPLPR